MKKCENLLIVLILGASASWTRADSLVLQNGQTVEGVFLGGDCRSVRLVVGDQVHTYGLSEIRCLEFRAGSSLVSVSASVAPPSGSAGPISIIPAGTSLEVRLIHAVDSKKDSSGRITGKTSLQLAIKNIRIGGETYEAASSSVSKASGSRTTNWGEVISGTAALGTLLRAIAGGGRGAAIGALSSGAVGTTAQVVTSGERVRVPSETQLTFTLSNPLRLSSAQEYRSNGAVARGVGIYE